MYRRGEATLESSQAAVWLTDGASGLSPRNLSGPIQSGEEPNLKPRPRAGHSLEFLMTVQSLSSNFADRHVGARRRTDIDTMLEAVGHNSVDGLVDTAVPRSIRQESPLALTEALCEVEVLAELRRLASMNKTAVQMIGQGYHETVTPPVIRRNILEAPAWYTAYTPCKPEISQGRLEARSNFQTMVQDLTALPVANTSLLDDVTAAAEAVLLMQRPSRSTN